jgi:NAD(P)-dependent dehydrogenase (short-subunit alcohol dehydrogenase family)
MSAIYLRAGAKVIQLDLRFEEAAEEGVTQIVCDLTDPAALEIALATILESSPTIDVLVHNAAFVGTSADQGWSTAFETQSLALFKSALDINLTAPFAITQKLAPALRASGRGSVIMVGSIYGLVGPDWSLYDGTPIGNPAGYAASKGGLMQLTRWLSTTLAPDIRVNAFSPGGVERGQDAAFRQRYIARTPLARMASPDDFQGVALFLASDMSAYMTGQVISVDGGWTAW